jgi:hypothetical protein
MKTYTKRTNAKRAAVAAGIPEAEVEISVHKVTGEAPRFGFKRKETQVQAPAKAATAVKRAPASAAPHKPRASAAGITRPRAGGKCDAVWRTLDAHPNWRLADARAWAEKGGHNVNNVVCEFYRWRKFSGVPANVAA